MADTPYPLGREPLPPDPRDRNFPMSLSLQATVPPTSKSWTPGHEVFNQGSLGACVGFAGAAWLVNSPVRHPRQEITNQWGFDLYWACKRIDGIPDTEGTYSRALMQVLSDQHRIVRYLWAQNPDELKTWVLTKGPVLVGTAWTEAMFDPAPDRHRELYLSPVGSIVGGHEYLIRQYSRPRDAYKMRNSWGDSWGTFGEAWIKASDLYSLVFDRGGDCVAAEEKLP